MKNVIPSIVLFLEHSVKYLKNVFTSVFTHFNEVLYLNLLAHFLEKIIFKRHFGFRSCYSSNDTIVNLVESIKKYIDNDNYMGSVFIDLEKGFDTADHQFFYKTFTIMVFEI